MILITFFSSPLYLGYSLYLQFVWKEYSVGLRKEIFGGWNLKRKLHDDTEGDILVKRRLNFEFYEQKCLFKIRKGIRFLCIKRRVVILREMVLKKILPLHFNTLSYLLIKDIPEHNLILDTVIQKRIGVSQDQSKAVKYIYLSARTFQVTI